MSERGQRMVVEAAEPMKASASLPEGQSTPAPRSTSREYAIRRLAGAISLLAILAAAGFLTGSFVAEELLARAFFLGAFTTSIAGGVVSLLLTRYRFSSGLTDSGSPGQTPTPLGGGAFPSRYRSIFDLAPLPMLEVDDTGQVVGANQEAEEWMQRVRAAWLQANPDEAELPVAMNFLDYVPGSEWVRVADALSDAADGGSVQLRHSYRIGTAIRSLSTRLVAVGTAMLGQPRILVIIEDVTDAEQFAEALAEEARSDSLTGLVNRREFEQRLARVLETAREDGSEHALLYLDLDQFKVVNDSCGHRAGDELLRQLARRLQAGVRRRDTLARIGGDEFGVLMERCTLPQAVRVAEILLGKVAEFQFAWADNTFSLGVSIGVASMTAAASDAEAVLSAADEACYRAKIKGRNRVQTGEVSSTLGYNVHSEQKVLNSVNEALERSGFELWRQEIRPASSAPEANLGSPAFYEVFLRLPGPDGDLLPPGAFLPAAHRYGLGSRIDTWVLAQLVGLDGVMGAGEALWSLNVSLDAFSDRSYLERLLRVASQGRVDPQHYCFELRETDVLAHLSAASRFAEQLKDAGFKLSLDGVGGSPTSLLYLEGMQPDFFKLDGTLTRNVVCKPTHRVIIQSVIELAAVMGKRTIAQQIEDQATLQSLTELSVDFVQGNHVSAPQPVRALTD